MTRREREPQYAYHGWNHCRPCSFFSPFQTLTRATINWNYPQSRAIVYYNIQYRHVGLRRYKRMNVGVPSATEIFQNTIRQTLEGIPGVMNISDDILIYGRNQDEHVMNVSRRHSNDLAGKTSPWTRPYAASTNPAWSTLDICSQTKACPLIQWKWTRLSEMQKDRPRLLKYAAC